MPIVLFVIRQLASQSVVNDSQEIAVCLRRRMRQTRDILIGDNDVTDDIISVASLRAIYSVFSAGQWTNTRRKQ